MNRGCNAGLDKGAHLLPTGTFCRQINAGGRACFTTFDFAQPDGLAQMVAMSADQPDRFACLFEGDIGGLAPIGHQADPTNGRRWQNGRPAARRLGFVVERDIPRHDGVIKRAARITHTPKAADNLRHDFGALRIGKVQAIGDRQRRCAHGRNVAIGLSHRLLAALIGISIAIARGAVGRDGNGFIRAMDADNCGIAAGGLHRVTADLVVILLPNPAA